MKNRKWKRGMEFCVKEESWQMPFDREDRLSAIVPIDRICVDGEEMEPTDAAFAELCESVKRNGVLQPLLVRRVCNEESGFGGLYLLVAGKRRLMAARVAGHRALPCYIVTMDAKEAAVTAYITDVNHSEKNMFECADAILDMKRRFCMTVGEIALQIGRSELYVAGKLFLARYTAAERAFILEKGVSEEVALVVLQVREVARRAEVLQKVWEKRLQGEAAQEYVRLCVAGSIPPPERALQDLRFFDNSVQRLMKALRNSGVEATLERHELAAETVVTIRVARKSGEGAGQQNHLARK